MLLFVTWCDSGQFNLGITYMQMQETEQFSTNRIPSHTGKRELAPQLPGNTPEQDKGQVGSGTLTFSDIHYGPATFAFFHILPDSSRSSRSGTRQWMHWCDVRGQIL